MIYLESNMNELTITCPSCKAEIKLTESLAAPLIEATRQEYKQKIDQKESEIAQREATLRERLANLAKAEATLDDQVSAKLRNERGRIAAEEAKKARFLLATDLEQKSQEVADLHQVLKERDRKLAEAQKAQVCLIRKQRELDDAKREMDLIIESKVQESLSVIRNQAAREATEDMRLKVLEKEEQIASMHRKIEELKRKAEQGSQQLQGEAQELELESLLRINFPQDVVEPVPKGEFGGDVLQRVIGPMGKPCGTILWESKRTKNWSDSWLPKLRVDQRAARAEVALLISQALPKGVETFNFIDGVWVTGIRCAIPVTIALRQSLIEIFSARQAVEGQQSKMEMVYQYLTGPRFRQRIQAIIERFADMQIDLENERKAMIRIWAKREEQLRVVIESTVGMYGDLQGITGKTLQEIDSFDTRLLSSLPGSDSDGVV